MLWSWHALCQVHLRRSCQSLTHASASVQTLLDPEKRAAYDALAGFTQGAVNPFVDAAYERDHVRRLTSKQAAGGGPKRRLGLSCRALQAGLQGGASACTGGCLQAGLQGGVWFAQLSAAGGAAGQGERRDERSPRLQGGGAGHALR